MKENPEETSSAKGAAAIFEAAQDHPAKAALAVEGDSPQSGRLMAQMGILVLVLAIVAGGLWQLFRFSTTDLIYRKELSVVSRELRESQAREHGLLTSYERLDEKEQVYQIPIRRAMELLVANPSRIGSVRPDLKETGGSQAAAGEQTPGKEQTPESGAKEQRR